jgi:integrase/recombinase XerD
MTCAAGKTPQALVQDFFVQHLTVERNASPNTIKTYRDCIKLYLRHASELNGCAPDELDHDVLDVKVVRSFLGWLERERSCGPNTRNLRLATLKSLARYVASVAPEHLERCRLIRELPRARVEQPEPQYLTEQEVLQLIAAPDATTAAGRRDRAMLLLMHNTGARVQEVVDLDIGDIHDEGVSFVRLLGKGRKERTCPLWPRTITAIQQMKGDRRDLSSSQPLFLSARGHRLTRSGIDYLLRRAEQKSGLSPQHARRLTPHVMRHTTAMHLLQSGVDITTIAAWLGHAQLSTTHAYVEIDLRMKQAAITKMASFPELSDAVYPAPGIIDWLENIGRGAGYVQSADANDRPRARDRPSLHIAPSCT